MSARTFILAALVAATSAAPVALAELQEIAAPKTIAEVNAGDGTYRVGDKVFSEIDAVTTASPGAFAPTAEQITLTGVVDDVTGEVGLKIVGYRDPYGPAWWARWPSEVINTQVRYRVSPDSPLAVDGNTLAFLEADADSGASVTINSDSYSDASETLEHRVSHLHVSESDSLVQYVDAEGIAPPLAPLWVVDDILLVATDNYDEAWLTSYVHTFSQVPGPATVVVLAVGGAAVVVRRFRRR